MSSLQQTKFKHSLAVQDAALLVLEAMEGDAGPAEWCIRAGHARQCQD